MTVNIRPHDPQRHKVANFIRTVARQTHLCVSIHYPDHGFRQISIKKDGSVAFNPARKVERDGPMTVERMSWINLGHLLQECERQGFEY